MEKSTFASSPGHFKVQKFIVIADYKVIISSSYRIIYPEHCLNIKPLWRYTREPVKTNELAHSKLLYHFHICKCIEILDWCN